MKVLKFGGTSMGSAGALRNVVEIGYEEVVELCFFGANVLHPKTIRPVIEVGGEVFIKNTFSPDVVGTKISKSFVSRLDGVGKFEVFRDCQIVCIVTSSETRGKVGAGAAFLGAISDAGVNIEMHSLTAEETTQLVVVMRMRKMLCVRFMIL